METTDPEMVQAMKGAIAANLSDLGPDEDMLPMLMHEGEIGSVITGLALPIETLEDHEALADMILATLIIDKAHAAVFASAAWMLTSAEEIEGSIADHPDRREVVLAAHATRDGHAVYVAEIHRSATEPPTIGEWEQQRNEGAIGGRMHDALDHGVRAGVNMPPELAAVLEGLDRQAAVEKLANMIYTIRVREMMKDQGPQ